MILRTIINSNRDALTRCLALSLMAHGIVWLIMPDPRSEIIVYREIAQTPERFVTVMLPAPEPKPQATPQVDPPKQSVSAPKVRPSQRLKKRRVRKRRVKRRHKRARRTVEVAKKSSPPQPVAEHDPEPPTSDPTPAGEVDSAPKAQVASAATKAPRSAMHKASKRASRSRVRGILRGYYRSLNMLMKRGRTYPRSARRLGIEGTVLVEMVVSREGEIIKVKVLRSSGHDLLDKAAVAQVQKQRRVPQIPQELNRPAMTFQIPIEYRLQS